MTLTAVVPTDQNNARSDASKHRCGLFCAAADRRMVFDRPCQLADQSLVYDGDVDINGDLVGPIPRLEARHICLQGSIQGPATLVAGSLGIVGNWRTDGQKAVVEIQGAMCCRDLAAVSGRIQGGLKVEGELAACDLDVAGCVDGAQAGCLRGGTLRLGLGGVLWSVLGGNDEPAELILGQSKGTPEQLENLLRLINKLGGQRDQSEGDALKRVSMMMDQAQQALTRLQQPADGFKQLKVVDQLQAGTRMTAGAETLCVQDTMFGAVVELVAGKIRVQPLPGPDAYGFVPVDSEKFAA